MYRLLRRLRVRSLAAAVAGSGALVAGASFWPAAVPRVASEQGRPDRCSIPSASASADTFDGRTLLALSDATMPASAFMDGKLTPGGRGTGGAQDSLTTLKLPLDIGVPRDPTPDRQMPQSGETFVDNSAIGPPYGISTSPDGTRAYVLRTRGNPPAGTTEVSNVFRDFPTQAMMSTVDISNPAEPRVIQTVAVGALAHTAQVSPDGRLLAINTDEPGRNLIIRRVTPNGLIGSEIQAVSADNPGQSVRRVGRVEWHPSGRFLAHGLPFKDELRFYRVTPQGNDVRLQQWGSPVKVGVFPDEGVFSPDGSYYFTTDLQWGDHVPGLFYDSAPGTITAVRFDAQHGKHRKTGQAPTDVSPEGIAVSPDGRHIVTANLTRSWHPWDSPRLTPEGSLNLLSFNKKDGTLKTVQQMPVDGILVEGLAFDKSGDSFALTVFDRFDPRVRRGALEFYQLVKPRGCQSPRIVNTNVDMEVPAGPHSLWLVP